MPVTMKMRQPGPNDFHFESESGGLVMKPGLGDDEPTEDTLDRVARATEANRQREEALNRAAEELAAEADIAERREADLDAREAALAARERALREATGTSSASNVERGSKAKQATDRTPAVG